MYPYIMQSLAAERARDMRKQAAAARRVRMARRDRRGPARSRDGASMTRTGRRQRGWRQLALVVRQLGRRIAAVVAECQYAQRRAAVLYASPDKYLPNPGRAPETYQEFLFRTSGPLMHETAAASRSTAPAVR
jgi:hypothetical protein